MVMRTVITGLALGALALLQGAVCMAQLAVLDSAHDGNGLFTYTLRPAHDTLVFGGDSNLTLRVPGHLISSVSNPPGWAARLEDNAVLWVSTNPATQLVAAPLQFIMQSHSTMTMLYDQLDPDAVYPMATIAGYVCTTNGQFYQPLSGNTSTSVYSINVAGFERLAFYGPVIPEASAWLALAACAIALFRKRTMPRVTMARVLLGACLLGALPISADTVRIVDFGGKMGSGFYRGIWATAGTPTVDRMGDGSLANDYVSGWAYSATTPLNPPGLDFDSGGLNARYYGGLTLYTHCDYGSRGMSEGLINQNHEFCDDFNFMTLPGPRTNPITGTVDEKLEAYGVFYWPKEDFLNRGAAYPVSFDSNSTISVHISRYWGGMNAARWLARDGAQFYLSEATFAGVTQQYDTVNNPGPNLVWRKTHTLVPTDTRWAPYTPVPGANPHEIDFKAATASFAYRAFTNVTAVGFFIEREMSTPYPASTALTLHEPIAVKWHSFQAQAVVGSPAAPARNLAMDTVNAGALHIASAPLSYQLWRTLVRFGMRRQRVEFREGVSYAPENSGALGMMRADDALHNGLEPVTDLTFYDALLACNMLSEFEGLEPAYYTDAACTAVFRVVFDRSFREQWNVRPAVFWKTNAPGFRLPTPAEWALHTPSPAASSFWEYVWFPAGVSLNPASDTNRAALGWSATAPITSVLPFGERPWQGSPRIAFRPVRNGNAAPQWGAAPGATVWTFVESTVLPPAAPLSPEDMRAVIAPLLPEVQALAGLATTAHSKDEGFNPDSSINPATAYHVYFGAHEIPYRLWRFVAGWAVNNGYRFNFNGDMGSMGNLPGATLHHPDEPVTQITLYDALVWCNALSEMLGKEPAYYEDSGFSSVMRTASQFRLETYQGDRYPNWGQLPANPVHTGFYVPIYMKVQANGYRVPLPQEWNLANATDANSSQDAYNWLGFNSSNKTQRVGTKLPNPIGLHDMEGNVRELTWGDTKATIDRATHRKGSYFARGYRASHETVDKAELPSAPRTHVGFRVLRLLQEFTAAPDVLEYAGTSDQTFSPRTLTVQNTGYPSVGYTISTSAAWFAIAPAAHGGLGNGQSAAHSISINAPLPGGFYQGHLLITPDNPAIPALTVRVDVLIVERGTGEVIVARVDFGRAPFVSTGLWNNITDPVSGAITGLLDTDGFENQINVAIIEPFSAMLDGGTHTPDAGLGWPASATRDAAGGGNPSSVLMQWGGDYIDGTVDQQMTWQLPADALSETGIRSPASAAFNRSRPGGIFYANGKRGADNSINYQHIVDNAGSNTISFQYRRDNSTGAIIGHAAFVWMKTNFLNGFHAMPAQLTRCRMQANSTSGGGTHTIRWLVKQGGQYYVSSNTYTITGNTFTTIDAPVSETDAWEAYQPTASLIYTPGSFTPMTMTNITALGYYIYSQKDNAPVNDILRLNVRQFEAGGREAGSQPVQRSRVRISGLQQAVQYELRCFASLDQPGANLQTEYRVHHATGVFTNHLNAAGNQGAVAATPPLRPNAAGHLDIELAAGPANTDAEGRYLLGVLEIVFTNLVDTLDTDGDGIPDWWEEINYGGPTNANADALVSNQVNTVREAYIADLDPHDPAAFFTISTLQVQPASTRLEWQSKPRRRYNVYWSEDPTQAFMPAGTNLTGNTFTDTARSGATQGFYRIDVRLAP